MADDQPMFCRRCYANLNQATHSRCARCNHGFNADIPASFLPRPFPSRRRMIVHTLITLVLSTLVSFVVAGFLAMAQIKYIHSGH
jgi:hypothetical protein